jgi:hypothetical protein
MRAFLQDLKLIDFRGRLITASVLIAILLAFGLFIHFLVFRPRNQFDINEQTAIGRLLEIKKAEDKFLKQGGKRGTLQELFDSGLIDSAAEIEQGYRFRVELSGSNTKYEVRANPVKYESTGIRSFYMLGESIHAGNKDGTDASKDDPKIALSDY